VTLTMGSLFSGIGGFELAGEWCGVRTIWQSEIDPYCTALLAERFPGTPNLGDITTIDWRHVERPDIVAGGFPCQDISYAGKGAGLAGERSGLWYEFARCIRELGPRYVIVENVRALFTRGFGDVLGTLADLGYDAEWAMYGAADVGAPHRRHRVWLLAYPSGRREAVRDTSGGGLGGESRRGDGAQSADGREAVADAERQRLEGFIEAGAASGAVDGPGNGCDPRWWATEPDVGRVAYGVPARLDRLRGLGNAIVPACAVPIFKRIHQLDAMNSANTQ